MCALQGASAIHSTGIISVVLDSVAALSHGGGSGSQTDISSDVSSESGSVSGGRNESSLGNQLLDLDVLAQTIDRLDAAVRVSQLLLLTDRSISLVIFQVL